MRFFSTLFLLAFFCPWISLAQCPIIVISGTNVNCQGGSTGTVSTSVTGGSGSYSYAWNNGEITPNLSGLTAGIYFVNVTDNVTGCTSMNLYNVTEPDQLLTFTTTQNVNCFSASTGSINLTLSGGTAPFSYQWSNNAQTQDISNLSAGSYNVVVTDFGGCTATASAVITQTTSAVNSNILQQSVSCPQGSDGSINLTPFGGEPPYTFSWNSGTYLSEDISGLTSGLYTVLITDGLGCTANNTITVTEPSSIQSSISATDVLCFGSASGNINLSPSGGTPPFDFTWTSSQFTLGNTEDLNNIFADTYSVIIIDANGCTAENTIIVNEPPQLISQLSGINISCYGFSDGSISQIVNGGSAPYSFAWFDLNGILTQNTQDIINLPAGTYEVIVSDFYACTASQNITLTQPLLPLNSAIVGTDAKCFGENSGTADLSVSGGTPPYIFSWSNGFLAEDQPNLFAGNYAVTVVDDNGCTSVSNVSIGQPAAALSSSWSSVDVTCFGLSNGQINFTVNGGTGPYSYAWVNTQFALSVVSQDIINFPAEVYVLTITDANQCVLVDTAEITQPPLLEISIIPTHILCFGDSTGAVDLNIIGGTPTYNILWSNNVVTEDQNQLFSGFYEVTVTDTKDCLAQDSVTLTQPAAPLSSVHFEKGTTCFGYQDGYIFYDVQGGTLPYNYNWSNGDSVNNIFNLTAGDYVITVTDGNACVLIDSLIVLQPDELNISSNVSNVSCFGESTGSIDLSISGGTLPYYYLWMNSSFVLNLITEDIDSIPASNYSITVTDSLGCFAGSQIEVTEPEPILVSLVASNISCGGGSDGFIDISVSGGESPYTYLWNNGTSNQDLNGVSAGTYTDTIWDNNGCKVFSSYILQEVPYLLFDIEVIKPSCILINDGSILVEVSNGSGNYTYAWDNGESENKVEKLKSGDYQLTVTDQGRCSQDTIITVPENPKECLEIPNTFTPNGDGKNDLWQIKNIDLYPGCEVSIFNRWGNRILKSKEYKEPWDGKFLGNKLPPETYFYLIDLFDGTEPRTGSVTIVY